MEQRLNQTQTLLLQAEALFESHAHITECSLSEIKQVGSYVPQPASHSLGRCSQCQITCIQGAEATTCNGAMPTLSLTGPRLLQRLRVWIPSRTRYTLTPSNEGQMVIMSSPSTCPSLGSSPAHTDHHSRHWQLLLNKSSYLIQGWQSCFQEWVL